MTLNQRVAYARSSSSRRGKEAVIFAMGVMVEKALQAAKELEAEGISAKVVNVSTLKPLDAEAVAASVQGAKGVVTAEEHNIYGGLGSAITPALAKSSVPVELLGIQDCFGRSTHDHEILMESYGLTAGAVAAADRAYVRFGPEKNHLGERIPLVPNTALHFPPLEWHVFEYDQGGFLEILYFYGQVDNIRTEEITAKK